MEVLDSEPRLWLGFPFVTAHFQDAVLAYAADGKAAALHGRVSPDRLQDPRPRKK